MADENGGPAFPSGNEVRCGDQVTSGHPGMTLRDYFAGQALNGWVSCMTADDGYVPLDDAIRAYQWADAMLTAREKS